MRYFLIIVSLFFSIHSSAMDKPSRTTMIHELSQVFLPKSVAMGLKAGVSFACQQLKNIKLAEGFNESLIEMVTTYYTKPYQKYIETLSDEHLNDLYVHMSNERVFQFAEKLVNCSYLPTTQPSLPCDDLVFPYPWLEQHFSGALETQKSIGLSAEDARRMLLPVFKKLFLDFAEEIDEMAKFKEKYPKHDAETELLFKNCQEQCMKDISVYIIYK